MAPAFLFGIPALLIGLIVAAAESGGPDLTGIAAIATATIGIIGFLATLLRGKRNNTRVEEVEQAASYVQGFDALIKRLQAEIEVMHTEMDQRQRQWNSEKDGLLLTIRSLRSDLQEQIAGNTVLKSELVELRGQIKGFLSKQQYEEFTKHL